jgi:hypothetical protein
MKGKIVVFSLVLSIAFSSTPAMAQLTNPHKTQAIAACRGGELNKAEQLMGKAWQDVQKNASQTQPAWQQLTYIDVLDGYQTIVQEYVRTHRYDRAETLEKWRISAAKTVPGLSVSTTAGARADLARIYMAQGKTAPAEQELKQALESLRGCREDAVQRNIAQASVHSTYADLCKSTGRVAETNEHRKGASQATAASIPDLLQALKTISGALKP